MQPMGSGDRGVSPKAAGGQQVSVPCLRLVAAGVDERGRLVETKRAFAGSAADLKGLLEFLCTDAAHTTRANDMSRYVKQQAKKRKKTGRSSSMEYDSLAESQRSQTMELRKREPKKRPIERIDKMQVSRLNWESEEGDGEASGEEVARKEDLRKEAAAKSAPYDSQPNGSIQTPVLGSQPTPGLRASVGGRISEAPSFDETMHPTQTVASPSPRKRHAPPKTAGGVSPRGCHTIVGGATLQAEGTVTSEVEAPTRDMVGLRAREKAVVGRELSAVPESNRDTLAEQSHLPRIDQAALASQLNIDSRIVSMAQLPGHGSNPSLAAHLNNESSSAVKESGSNTLAKEFSLKILGSHSRQVLANAVSFAEMHGIESSDPAATNQLASVPTDRQQFAVVISAENNFSSNASQTEPAAVTAELRELVKMGSTRTIEEIENANK